MAVFRWVGGSTALDQGRFEDASQWNDLTTGTPGAAVPGVGDVADVTGVVNTGIYQLGALFVFPLAGGFPLIQFEPAQDPNLLVSNPNGVVGDTVQGVTFNIDGTAGAVSLWLENSHLVGDAINVTGTTVLSAYLDDTISGTINVGTATTSGFLQANLIPLDTSNVGPLDHYPTSTFNATVNIAAGSTLSFEAGTGLVSGVVNNGTINVRPGGTFIVDDIDDPGAATDTSGVDFAFEHNLLLGNGGTINLEGGAGLATTAVFLADVGGPGVINVNGNGAARTATNLRIDGSLQDQTVTLIDGTIAVNDASTSIDVGSGAGFDVSGGSFTFGDGRGELVLHQVPLTSLQFNADATGMVQTPNGRTPFTTPIHGFGLGDVIALPGKYLGAYGASYVTAYNAATGVLQVQSPAGVAGNPPEILASLNMVGHYNPPLFHLGGSASTGELDLTYTGNAAVAPSTTDLNGDGHSDILWQNRAGSVVDWGMAGPAISGGVTVRTLDPSWTFLGTGDFNGDGDADLLWQNTAGAVVDWTMNGPAITSGSTIATLDPTWRFLGTGDFNGDGTSDILWRNGAGSVVDWTMSGGRIAGGATVGSQDSTWTFLGAGDFNGDGKSDLLWQNSAGAVQEWTMNGASVASKTTIATLSPDWKFLAVGDLDGDFKSDILWQNGAGMVVDWTMNGTSIAGGTAVATLDSSWKALG